MNIYKTLLIGAVLAPLSLGLGSLAFAAQTAETGEPLLIETQEAANTGTADADQATDPADNGTEQAEVNEQGEANEQAEGNEQGEVNDPADIDAEG